MSHPGRLVGMIGTVGVNDFEGLSFGNDGTLFGTTGSVVLKGIVQRCVNDIEFGRSLLLNRDRELLCGEQSGRDMTFPVRRGPPYTRCPC